MAGLYTLLLVLVADIILSPSIFSPLVVIILSLGLPRSFVSFFSYFSISADCAAMDASADAIFWEQMHGLDSFVGAFYLFLVKGIRLFTSIRYLIRSLAPCLHSLTYESLTTTIC